MSDYGVGGGRRVSKVPRGFALLCLVGGELVRGADWGSGCGC